VNNPLAENVPLERFPVIDPGAAFAFLRSRRSIRCYREDGVPREDLLRLLDIARFAPSGHNSQGISYIVVEGAGHLGKVRNIIVDWMKLTLSVSPEMANRFRMPALIAAHEQGEDKILRSAPHIVVAHAPKALMPAQATTYFALEYVELYAAAMGLGTCWAGYAQVCAQMYPPLAAFLNIPEDRQVTGILMVGYPKYGYYRLPLRNPLDVAWFGESGR
jgi:nitroreductase